MPHPGSSQSQEDDRTANGGGRSDCDHVEMMAKRVQIGEDLMTVCFEQEDRGDTPDWELLRGLPGRCSSILIKFSCPPSSIYNLTLVSLGFNFLIQKPFIPAVLSTLLNQLK